MESGGFRVPGLRRCCFFLSAFLSGGFLYGLVEILFRGYTHISMFLLGGLCFVLIGDIRRRFSSALLPEKMLLCGLVITALELVCGLLVNRVLALGVWDYSSEPLNVWGQICLPYTACWCLLSLPAMALDRLFCRYSRLSGAAEKRGASFAQGHSLHLLLHHRGQKPSEEGS